MLLNISSFFKIIIIIINIQKMAKNVLVEYMYIYFIDFFAICDSCNISFK